MPNIVLKNGDPGLHKDMRAWISRYFEEEVVGIQSDLTASAKKQDLAKFILFYENINGHLRANEWLPRDTRSFMDELIRQGYKASSVNRCLATLRSFGWFLREQGMVTIDPCKSIRDLQIEPFKPKRITDLEYHRLQKAADVLAMNESGQDVRNRAIMECLNASGLRISEALNLKLGQVQGRKLLGVYCKGGRVRDVLISKAAAELLADYIQNHRVSGSDYLFTNRYGGHLSRNSASEALNRIAAFANASLKPQEQIHLHCHALRHRHGYLVRKAHGDVFAQKRLGHMTFLKTRDVNRSVCQSRCHNMQV